MEFAQAKSKLTTKDANGHSVFELLSRITREVLEKDISDPLEKFENISMRVKRDIAELDGSHIPEPNLVEIRQSDEQAMTVVTQLYQLYGGKQEIVIPEPVIEPEEEVVVDSRQSDDNADGDGPNNEEDEAADKAEEENPEPEANNEEAEEEEELDPEEIAARERAHKLRMEETIKSVTNVLDLNHKLQWAGFRFDEEQLYQLHCSLTALAKFHCDEFSSVRFWGKVHGTDADYWIAELTRRKLVGDLTEEEKTALLSGNPQRELPGEGTNEKVYCAINDPANINEWQRLPDIEDPQQITKSKSVYKLLTGTLSTRVAGISASDFEWTESVLLRALIARITSATQVSPSGAFSLANEKSDQDEEDAEEEEDAGDEDEADSANKAGLNTAVLLKSNPDFYSQSVKKSTDNADEDEAEDNDGSNVDPSQLYSSLEGWVHTACQINNAGRVSDYIEPKQPKPEGDEDAEEDAEENEDADENDEDADPADTQPKLSVPLLQTLSYDVETPIQKGAKPKQQWNIRQYCPDSSMETVCVKSLVWEGAVTVMDVTSKQWTNFYCGNGLEFTGRFYTPTLPPLIQANYNEWRTFEEEIVAPEKDENAEDSAEDGNADAEEAADGAADNEEEDAEPAEPTVVTRIESVFKVQKEVPPPPPEPEAAEDGVEEDGDAEAEE